MPDLTYTPNFLAVPSANPNGWYDNAGNEWFVAYGFYGDHDDEGAHVFKRKPTGELIDVDLHEPRPPQRGLLCLSRDGGLELRSHRLVNGRWTRCVIPIEGVVRPVAGLQGPPGPRGATGPAGPAGPPGAAAPVDPRLKGFLDGLAAAVKALLGLK